MPWREATSVSLRQEFVVLASQPGANFAELCRRFGIHRDTGYKWLARYKEGGLASLEDRSRRPHHSPRKLNAELEGLILQAKEAHPAWGGRKLKDFLESQGLTGIPSASTITEVLRRNGRLDPAEGAKHQPFIRFEHDAPNRLWQMDFKGHFEAGAGRCHPLTVLDDHSRFSICLVACANERGETVKKALTQAFRHYGLPERMTMDNGAPWGVDSERQYTPLTAWLIRLGIRVGHSRPYHPQTQGKAERFHRTLKAELLRYRQFSDLEDCQIQFDRWRDEYNLLRPHQALGSQVPGQRYQPSSRAFPESLPPIEYGPDDQVRMVQDKGYICFQGQKYVISKAFYGLPVALRQTLDQEMLEVYFCDQRVARIDLRSKIVC